MTERISYMFKVLSLVLSITGLTSCIYDNEASCMQYAVKPFLADNKGVQRSDTAVKSIRAYLFTRGKFEREITTESSGRFIVSFNKRLKSSLALLGYPSGDSLSVRVPEEGESMDDAAATLLSSTGNSSPEGLYYGCFNYTPSSSVVPSSEEISVPMCTKRATVHVVVENLTEMYGSGGDYIIELRGQRNEVAFNDTIMGDSITYTPKASFDNKDNLCSDAVYTFPTKNGERIQVTIYRDDKLIWQSSKDSGGNGVSLSDGDDKALLVNVELRNTGIQVMSWSDYSVSTIIN